MQERDPAGAGLRQIEAAAIGAVDGLLLVFEPLAVGAAFDLDLRAVHLLTQQTADLQHGIADGFGFQTQRGFAPEQFVGGISGHVLGDFGGALPVRLRHHDLLREPLQIPVVFLEADGQIVEQFRMGGFRSLRAEIVHGANDAFAEMPLPDAVDEDAGDKRILAGHHPVGQDQAAVGAVPFRMFFGVGKAQRIGGIIQHHRNAGLHFGAGREIVAALQHIRGRRGFRNVPSGFDVIRRDFRFILPAGALDLQFVFPRREFGEALFEFLIRDGVFGGVAVHFQIGIGLDVLADLGAFRGVGKIAAGFQFGAVPLVGGFEKIVQAAEGFGVRTGHVLDPRGAGGFVHVEHHAARPGSEIQIAGQPVFGVEHRLVDGHQLVIVTLQERVELVVMATRALDGETQSSRKAGFHRLLLRVEIFIDFVDGLVIRNIRGGAQEAGRGKRLDLIRSRPRSRFVIDQLIARHLLD